MGKDEKPKKEKKSKYKNEKCVIDGVKFDSVSEGDFYLKLKEHILLNEIKSFTLQPKFTLQPRFKHRVDGNIGAITYTADFEVVYNNGDKRIVDIKGHPSPVALNSRKLFLNKFPELTLIWLTKSKKYSDTGWIDYFVLKKIRRENRKKKEQSKNI